jgi:flagellin-like hook-associated protein FlgL
MLGGVSTLPSATYARGGDDDRTEVEDDRDEDEDDEEDEDEDDDNSRVRRSIGTSTPLEAEADVFTDTTIIKVEMRNGSKSVFTSNADTREEVVDAIVSRLGLVRSEVESVLDFEVENRASRAKERDKVTGTSHTGTTSSSTSNTIQNADVHARIRVLESLLTQLIALLTELKAQQR